MNHVITNCSIFRYIDDVYISLFVPIQFFRRKHILMLAN